MLLKKTRHELNAAALRTLFEDGQVTNANPGGIARTLLEITNEQLGSFYDSLQLNHAMGFISTAAGSFLDLIGEGLFAVYRGSSLRALATKEDMNVKFFTDGGGAMATLLPSKVIPAGTTVGTSDGTIIYSVTENVAFDDVQSEVFVPVLASTIGPDNNVGAGLLTTDSLGVVGISSTNLNSIANGTEIESDSNYRYRVSNAILNYERANEISIRLAALSVPGIADVSIYDNRSGVGTFDVLVIPVGNVVPREAINAVRSAVRAVKAVGVLGSIRQPDYVPLELNIRLTFTAGTTDAEKADTRRDVVSSLLVYIGQVPLGGTFILNEMRQRVMETSDKIRDMETLCYIFRRRPQLLRNFQLEDNELLLPDPESDEPLKVV